MFPGSRRSSQGGRSSGTPRYSASPARSNPGRSPRAGHSSGRSGASRRSIAYAYFAIDRYDWSGQRELPTTLWDRVYTAATQGMYSLYEPTDPNLPQGQYTGVLMQVGCLEGVPFSDARQRSFVHDALVRTTREKFNRYRRR